MTALQKKTLGHVVARLNNISTQPTYSKIYSMLNATSIDAHTKNEMLDALNEELGKIKNIITEALSWSEALYSDVA